MTNLSANAEDGGAVKPARNLWYYPLAGLIVAGMVIGLGTLTPLGVSIALGAGVIMIIFFGRLARRQSAASVALSRNWLTLVWAVVTGGVLAAIFTFEITEGDLTPWIMWGGSVALLVLISAATGLIDGRSPRQQH